MKKLFISLLSLVLLFGKVAAQPYNYAEALQKSLLFYDTQRSGDLSTPASRANWRGNSHMRDGSVLPQSSALPATATGPRWNLTGGWYDGGGHVKWNSSMSFALSTLAWGAAEYKAGYVSTGQMPFLLNQLRWCGDYFVKCVTYTDIDDVSTYRIALEVGIDTLDGTPLYPAAQAESNFEAPREVIHRFSPRRPVFYANNSRPQPGQVAAMAAGLASAAFVLRDNGDITKSDQYLAVADKLYEFAKTYKVVYNTQPIIDPLQMGEYKNYLNQNVKVNGPALPRSNDPLCWAAIWLHKAHNLKDPAFGEVLLEEARAEALTFQFECWNSVYSISAYKFATFIMLSRYYLSTNNLYGFGDVPGVPFLNQAIEQCLDIASDSVATPRNDDAARGWSAGGLVRLRELGSHDRARGGFGKEQFGTLRHANNLAFVAFIYADQIKNADPLSGYVNTTKSDKYIRFAKKQLDYALGTNPQNRSYVHGFQASGKSVLTTAPHSTARGTWAGREHDIAGRPEFQPNYRHVPFGALVGGPDWKDRYYPITGLPVGDTVMPRGMRMVHQAKLGIDANAGFTGSLARMAALPNGGTVIANFPAPSPRVGTIDEEYFVEAEQTTTPNSIQIRARMNNRSRWPAMVRNRMSFRYYYDAEPGAVITASIVPFTGPAPAEAGLSPQISAPVNYTLNKHYVTITFPGDTIFPGFAPPRARSYYREVIFKLTSSTTWDNTNDWSFGGGGFAPLANVVPPVVTPKIAVFDNNVLIGGQGEPLGLSGKTAKVNFSLSPNPAKNDINLAWDLSSNQTKQVDIYDMLGKKVSSFKNVTGNNLNIQLVGLKSGIYIVDVRLSNNMESLGKIKFVKE